MPFNSLQYACFLPVVVLFHYVVPRRLRPLVLLLASYGFYASYNAVFLLLIVGLTGVNYIVGMGMARAPARSATRTTLLVLGLVLDIAVLAFYKYTLFLLHSLASLLSVVHVSIGLPAPDIFLPLGISFFTFEFIHYLIEVGRGSPAVISPLRFAVFAAFFPTQIAGPIKRYQAFVPQLEQPARFDAGRFGVGLRMIILGLFKKVALADNLAPLVNRGFATAPAHLIVGDAWLVALAFALQIYFDFSGFTDLARGSARLLGYEVPQNFRRPYLAVNPSEFWRRWHMSLSTWFRDYLYIPLGGRQRHRYRNLWLTMVIAGLWHGANWTFVVWGAIHGTLLVLYWGTRALVRRGRSDLPVTGPSWRPLFVVLGWAATFTSVCVAWVFFRAPTITDAAAMAGAMGGLAAGTSSVLSSPERLFIGVVAAGLILVELLIEWSHWLQARATRLPSRLASRMDGMNWHLQPVVCALCAGVTLLFQPAGGPPFIYFHF